MSSKRTAIFKYGLGRQQGAALMILVVILIVGVAALFIGELKSSSLQIARDKITADALAQAKDALLGYAVSDPNRPGELPCPDIDNDGMVTMADYSGSNCQSLIGRLPWKTLKLPDLRDGSGEHLWYAITDAFHANGSAIINSNTKGALLVYGPDGVTLQTQANYSAVAVIFSPGSPVGSQTRNTVTQQNNVANYLDSANGTNNAIGLTYTPPRFIAGAKSDTFNDQLLYITTQNLIPLVEQRVAGVIKKALDDYYAATPSPHYYPWADIIGGAPDYNANDNVNRGWIPQVASTSGPGPSTNNWVAGSPPQWFFDNQWYTLIYYSVAPLYAVTHNSGTLTVDGITGTRVLFFMPGTYNGTRVADNLSECLEDSENTNLDDLYITPTSQTFDRDRLYQFTSGWQP
jgi:type II secretory pathway pseudopilin PulG